MASSIDASWAEASDPERESPLALPLAEQQPGEPAAHPAVPAAVSPGEPAETELTAPIQPLTEGSPFQEGAAAPSALADEPGEPDHKTVGKGAARDVPATMHPSARSYPHVPQVGEEIAMLGQELGTALCQRRTAERRSIFAQRRALGPDDSPYQHLSFDPSIEYRGVEWGQPVPQEEWERR
eukprot:1673562-Amphidinium_carterae.1